LTLGNVETSAGFLEYDLVEIRASYRIPCNDPIKIYKNV
jgi:hypothetical protein